MDSAFVINMLAEDIAELRGRLTQMSIELNNALAKNTQMQEELSALKEPNAQ